MGVSKFLALCAAGALLLTVQSGYGADQKAGPSNGADNAVSKSSAAKSASKSVTSFQS